MRDAMITMRGTERETMYKLAYTVQHDERPARNCLQLPLPSPPCLLQERVRKLLRSRREGQSAWSATVNDLH